MDRTLQQILQQLIDLVRENEALKQEILQRDAKLKLLQEIEKA
jgi:hypothetical protein